MRLTTHALCVSGQRSTIFVCMSMSLRSFSRLRRIIVLEKIFERKARNACKQSKQNVRAKRKARGSKASKNASANHLRSPREGSYRECEAQRLRMCVPSVKPRGSEMTELPCMASRKRHEVSRKASQDKTSHIILLLLSPTS